MNRKQWLIYLGYKLAEFTIWLCGVMWALTKIGAQLFYRWVAQGRVSRRFWPL